MVSNMVNVFGTTSVICAVFHFTFTAWILNCLSLSVHRCSINRDYVIIFTICVAELVIHEKNGFRDEKMEAAVEQ